MKTTRDLLIEWRKESREMATLRNQIEMNGGYSHSVQSRHAELEKRIAQLEKVTCSCR